LRSVFRLIVILLFILISEQSFCQQQAQNDTIPERAIKKEFPLKGYVFPNYEFSQNPNGLGGSAVIALVLIYKNKYRIGGFASAYIDDHTERLIFPNAFDLIYGHSGFSVGYQLYDKDQLSAYFDLKTSFGQAIWEDAETSFNFSNDKFTFINPTVGIEYQILKFLAMSVELGFRKINGLELRGLEASDFDGITLNGGIKIGLFQ